MRKKLILIAIVFLLLPNNAKAEDWGDNFWFEPTLMCVGFGGVAYQQGTSGKEMQAAGYGCIGGLLVGYFINEHYSQKFSREKQAKINRLETSLKQMEKILSQKAANGDTGAYSLRVQEIIPGEVLPTGEVTAPTVREKLILPTYDYTLGD